MKVFLSNETNISTILFPNTISIVVGLICAIIGNVTVMYIQWVKLKSFNSFRLFIPYIALSDLCSSIVCSAFSIYNNYHWQTWDNLVLCKVGWFFVCLMQWISVSFLLVIAFQRYRKICLPHHTITSWMKTVLFVGVFIVVLFEPVSISLFAGLSELETRNNTQLVNLSISNEGTRSNNQCRLFVYYEEGHLIFTYIDNSIRSILIITVVFLYLKCGIKIHKLSKNIKRSFSDKRSRIKTNTNGNTSFPRELVDDIANTLSTKPEFIHTLSTSFLSFLSLSYSTNDVREPGATKGTSMTNVKCQKYRNINLMFAFMTFVVVIAYTPRLVIIFLDNSDIDFLNNISGSSFLLLVSLYRLYMITYFVNPIVYSVMDTKFRNEVKILVRCFCCNICRLCSR